MFSIQVDSTQYIRALDQAEICICNIFNGKIKNRLFSLLKIPDSSVQEYH